MKNHNKKHRTWNVILFSGARSSVKKIKITKKTKLLFYMIILINVMILLSIANYVMYKFEEKVMEQEVLNKEIEKRDLVVKEVKSEMEGMEQEYLRLQEDAIEVQRSIEEFKAFEELLNDIELDLPIDPTIDGSGGVEVLGEDVREGDISERLIELRSQLPNMISEFEMTVEKLLAYEAELRTIPTIMPSKTGRITSEFGTRYDPFTGITSFHSGIDIASSLNTPIYATADGIVTFAGWDGPYGQTVIIEHGNTYETLYAHLNHTDVQVGESVKKGDKIGGMGTTGRSTGIHLHYEIKRNGEYVNPYIYMTFHER
ncbi:M23 family metallopeptidase [Evansella sp. AB-P1]|uniref:M23 family metallopeptidase n=1 Tax=Evansella sp. AB-P1 TaxID=3037653 RepID=UPI00241DAB85|nr:M23 family metallopeptidase [Evansella sp. AB-P1]MDG5787266.1 M23 family metallopeptidase [Evansella sp. AB-P1]